MIPTSSPHLLHRLERLAGQPIRAIRPVNRGYTPAIRLVITLADGTSLFAKTGSNELTAGFLRQEYRVYQELSGTFIPHMLAWEDDGDEPILLLEDLSGAHWPPPWEKGQVNQVLDTLPLVWQSSVPGLPRLADMAYVLDGWQRVAADPEPFLSLGLVTGQWLQATLPALLAADGPSVADGSSLLHLDLRSDNICLTGDRVVLIDWNLAVVGNHRCDLGFWLPSLQAEGGPLPESLLPDSGEIAVLVSGYLASRAGLPLIPDAPLVRQIQLVQLRTALPWAVRVLGLPGLDGCGDAETRRRGDAETRGPGDAGTRRRGGAEMRGRGDAGTRGRGDAGTRRGW